MVDEKPSLEKVGTPHQPCSDEVFLCTTTEQIEELKKTTHAFFRESSEDREQIREEIKKITAKLDEASNSNKRIFSLWKDLSPIMEEIKIFMAVKKEMNGNTEKKVEHIECNEDLIEEKIEGLSVRVGQMESSLQLLLKIISIALPVLFTIILSIQGITLYTLLAHIGG